MKRTIFSIVILFALLCACRQRPQNAGEHNSPSKTEDTLKVASAHKIKQEETSTLQPVADTAQQIEDSTLRTVKDSVIIKSDENKEGVETKQQSAQQEQSMNLVLDMEKTTYLIGSICLFFLILIYAVYRKLNREIKGFRNSSSTSGIVGEITALEQKIQKLQSQLNLAQNGRSSYAPRAVDSPALRQSMPSEFQVKNECSEPLEQVLYFSALRRFDNGEIGFDASRAKSSFVSAESKYRLTVNNDRTTSRFDLVADNFADMINLPQDFVDPVCQVQGQNTPNTRRVVCLRAGKARAMGGNWIVTEKMIVRYE